jgi:hypothetical protein
MAFLSRMVVLLLQALIVSNAGLVKYLMDAMPENHWAEP